MTTKMTTTAANGVSQLPESITDPDVSGAKESDSLQSESFIYSSCHVFFSVKSDTFMKRGSAGRLRLRFNTTLLPLFSLGRNSVSSKSVSEALKLNFCHSSNAHKQALMVTFDRGFLVMEF